MTLDWRYIAESLRGASHAAENSPCQDASAAKALGDGEASCLVACVADGAGSAKHSDRGSAIACEAVLQSAADYYHQHSGFGGLDQSIVHRWLEAARQRIAAAAGDEGCEVRQFATTLLVVIASRGVSHFVQIGDGAIILGRAGVYGVAFWPQSGEYVNTTNFLTGDQFEQQLEFHSTDASFDEVALLTDGLERLALDFEKQTPHAPFCQPLFSALRSTDDRQRLSGDLRSFLQSEPVSNRSDDDKSLILASRRGGDDQNH